MKKSKRFFFEKKNQKTFTLWSQALQENAATAETKVFCFFFSKKKCFL